MNFAALSWQTKYLTFKNAQKKEALTLSILMTKHKYLIDDTIASAFSFECFFCVCVVLKYNNSIL